MDVDAKLDHLVVAARTLAEGVAYVERRLGVTMAPGGQHPLMGTHNRLLSLGDIYLEVITIDPDAPRPAHARWFALDRFQGPPRMTNWVVRVNDLDAALALAPPGVGTPLALSRGDLRWRMAVPLSGVLPFDNVFPALIEWQGDAHPAARLPKAGCRLDSLQIGTSEPTVLRAALNRLGGILGAQVPISSQAGFTALIATPNGPVTLK